MTTPTGLDEPGVLTPERLANVPLFPLPDLVFFPGTLLPLHIFEPRYREMTRDLLREPVPLLVVARLKPGWESDYHGSPPVFDVAGIGVVIHHEALEDGRYNLLLSGLGRIRSLAPIQQAPYRRVRAELLLDRYPPATDLGGSTAALLALSQRLALRAPELGRALRELGESSEPALVADVLGSVILRDPQERQALLETLDVGERLSRVTQVAAGLLSKLHRPGDAPN